MNQYEPGRGIALSACASTLFALRQRLPLLRQLVARAVSEPRVGLGLAVSAARNCGCLIGPTRQDALLPVVRCRTVRIDARSTHFGFDRVLQGRAPAKTEQHFGQHKQRTD